MDTWGKNKTINMEWRGSQHAVPAEPPGKRGVRPAQALPLGPSTALSSALLKTLVVDLVLREGGQE